MRDGYDWGSLVEILKGNDGGLDGDMILDS